MIWAVDTEVIGKGKLMNFWQSGMFQNGFYRNLFNKSLFVGIVIFCFLFLHYSFFLTPSRENVDFQAVPVFLVYRVLQ